MKRIHLFEFEDFHWFPAFIRDGGTDFLGFLMKTINYYQPAAKLLEEAILQTPYRQVLDLCSGSGGPIEHISQAFDTSPSLQFILSDKYPNQAAYRNLKEQSNGRIDYLATPLDVMDIDTELSAFRTMFSAIHHFEPDQVQHILSQCIEIKMPIGIFDSADKHLGTILGILLFHPLIFLF